MSEKGGKNEFLEKLHHFKDDLRDIIADYAESNDEETTVNNISKAIDEHFLKTTSKTFSIRVRNDIDPELLDKKFNEMMRKVQAWLEE